MNLNVDVINGYHHLGVGGGGGTVTLNQRVQGQPCRPCDCNSSIFCLHHEYKSSALLTVPVSNVLRIDVLHRHEKKLHHHDGIVMVEVDSLVKIPPCGEPPHDRTQHTFACKLHECMTL